MFYGGKCTTGLLCIAVIVKSCENHWCNTSCTCTNSLQHHKSFFAAPDWDGILVFQNRVLGGNISVLSASSLTHTEQVDSGCHNWSDSTVTPFLNHKSSCKQKMLAGVTKLSAASSNFVYRCPSNSLRVVGTAVKLELQVPVLSMHAPVIKILRSSKIVHLSALRPSLQCFTRSPEFPRGILSIQPV